MCRCDAMLHMQQQQPSTSDPVKGSGPSSPPPPPQHMDHYFNAHRLSCPPLFFFHFFPLLLSYYSFSIHSKTQQRKLPPLSIYSSRSSSAPLRPTQVVAYPITLVDLSPPSSSPPPPSTRSRKRTQKESIPIGRVLLFLFPSFDFVPPGRSQRNSFFLIF